MPHLRPAHPLVIGHRGARRVAVENTLESLKIAIDQGGDGVEFDVQVTADGEPVLFHDDDLRRLTGRPETVAQLTWRELAALPQTDGDLRAVRVTHLDEVLEWSAARKLWMNAELKVDPADSGQGRRLAEVFLRRVRNQPLEQWVVSSFVQTPLRVVAEQRADLKLGALVDERPPCDAWNLLDAPQSASLRHYGIHPPYALVTAARVTAWRQAGLQVWSWTANAPRDWEALVLAQVDAIISDTPGALVQFLAA